MKIELKEITVKKIADGFDDSDEAGVVVYGGNPDIGPTYQREFIYGEKRRNGAVDTVWRAQTPVECTA